MGRMVLEFFEMAARMAGMHGLAYWFRDEPYALLFIIGAILVLVFVAWICGNALFGHLADDNEPTFWLVGGCAGLVVLGVGLIFLAGVVWSARYLFG